MGLHLQRGVSVDFNLGFFQPTNNLAQYHVHSSSSGSIHPGYRCRVSPTKLDHCGTKATALCPILLDIRTKREREREREESKFWAPHSSDPSCGTSVMSTVECGVESLLASCRLS